eukprot:Plantae.Rhodophyta-Hildenbrandia_rubra.ctg2903.p1 GENE.Plantae.Rhodophyta-Hildenbrandia_rubra.ctg2903~~Plantae.Rhodophyta-Hildenbrandia_rubra.ctg2903.p1  ORF type:complete len:776 (-),score=95.53 Plantae.Rhodophyta-Hildenbrandia_rubra.ctg2903:2972-5299(-)
MLESPRTLLIDNYDSYTHNLYHLLALSNPDSPPPLVVKNDSFSTLHELLTSRDIEPISSIVISPGPGHPSNIRDFPQLCRDAVKQADIPVFGVCLGHQGIVTEFGGVVEKGEPVHGRVSEIICEANVGLWKGLSRTLNVVRYHSLVATRLGKDVDVIARLKDRADVMAVKVQGRCCWGVQFHPESISTQKGRRIAENFCRMAKAWRPRIDSKLCSTVSPERGRSEEAKNVRQNEPKKNRKGSLKVYWRRVDNVASSALEIFRSMFAESSYAWWLDSSLEDQTTSRFSFMGDSSGPLSEVISYDTASSTATITDHGTTRVETLQKGLIPWIQGKLQFCYVAMEEMSPGLPFEFNCGYVGSLGYELKHETDVARVNVHRSLLPDATLVFADRLVAIDHANDGRVYLVAAGKCFSDDDMLIKEWFVQAESELRKIDIRRRQSPTSVKDTSLAIHKRPSTHYNGLEDGISKFSERPMFTMDRACHEYMHDVNQCLEKIRDGDTYEVCLTNRIRSHLPQSVSSLSLYKHLRDINPAPYAAYLKMGEKYCVCCSSPERFLKACSSGVVESKPIKGTRRRGGDPYEDKKLVDDLASSIKDRSENLMIVDLARNDLGRVCDIGSVRVPSFMKVETYAAVHQLVSTIEGKLPKGVTVLECFKDIFPMGSMTGAPKTRTMEIIDRLEASPRGIYSGTIGYFALCGAADLNVTIRTAVIHDREVTIGVGGAVVALSSPREEFDETVLKGDAIMKAISRAVYGRDEYFLDVEGCSKALDCDTKHEEL